MTTEHCCFLIIFCGLLGIFLRRHFSNVAISLLQIIIGFNALIGNIVKEEEPNFSIYLIPCLIFTFVIYMKAIAVLLIKRRSTLSVNELTELRG